MRRIYQLVTIALLSCPATATSPNQHAVASAHPIATEAGINILSQGGNAFDAAIAVASTLAVVEPYSAGMGGGGFWLLHQGLENRSIFVDAREMAPAKAHRNMYLNEDGAVDRDLAINGPLAAGIPGQAAAFVHIAKHYGKLPLSQTLKPSIQVARDGFKTSKNYQRLAKMRHKILLRYPASQHYLDNGQAPKPGYLLKQPQLSKTLSLLAQSGFDGFYQGNVAQEMISSVNAAGGIWTLADLKNYKIVERKPIEFHYLGHKITSAPPPSSGGIALATMLNTLSLFPLAKVESLQRTHLTVEAMRRAYRDRAEFLGDPDFIEIPTQHLISDDYGKQLAATINKNKATPSLSLQGPANIVEGFHTTHLSVLDKEGNRVSATLSINLPFGSAFVAGNTGVLLNNEMDDFSAKPGSPNAYGLVGAEANAIEPRKRPLSSMSPSFVENSEQVAILGTPGGSRIITMVLLGILEHVDQQPVEAWVSRPRFHHQYLPDTIQFEPSVFSDMEQAQLKALGHDLKLLTRQYGNMQAILWDKTSNKVTAASDPRGHGKAITQNPLAPK